MDKTITFYFDFMSPYAYLAYQRLPKLAEKYGFLLALKPIDLAFVKRAAGNMGPATREVPSKLRYALGDISQWATRYGAPFVMRQGLSLNSDILNKGTFYAIDKGVGQRYVSVAWMATYGAGGGMDDEEVIRAITDKLSWSFSDFMNYVKSPDAQSRYQSSIDEAVSCGVFGVPATCVGDRMWWGNDRLDFVEEFLQGLAGSKCLIEEKLLSL